MISHRAKQLPISSVRKLLPYAFRAKEQGVKIHHLNIGAPDVLTPQVMVDALKKWETNPISYAPSGGTEEFIKALLWYYAQLGHTFLDKQHLISTIGSSEAIYMALFATCNPGDKILVFEPFYSSYATTAKLVDVSLIAVPTSVRNGFHLPSKEEIIKRITPKTKAILFSNPCNPTGTVYTIREIEMLVAIAKEYNIFLISDEVYREYLFVERPHISLLSYLKEIPTLAIVVDSLSKRYNLCGSRLGIFISMNEDLLTSAMRIAMSRLSGGLIDQYVGSFLTDVPTDYISSVQKEYKVRRDLMFDGLQAISGITVARPEGAFYIMAELPVEDSETFCIWLLERYRNNNETVMFAPANGFYKTKGAGKNSVRIAYVLKKEKLKRSLVLLEDGLKQYNNQAVDR